MSINVVMQFLCKMSFRHKYKLSMLKLGHLDNTSETVIEVRVTVEVGEQRREDPPVSPFYLQILLTDPWQDRKALELLSLSFIHKTTVVGGVCYPKMREFS